MINYTPQNQLRLELFKHPFEQELDKENRWVKYAAVIPWDEIASVYASKLSANTGRKSVDIRTVIAALIVKHELNLDDRGTIQMIQENIYLQYFCGLKSFTTRPVFDPSLFVDIRKRLGGAEFDKMNRYIIEKSESVKPSRSRIKTNKKTKTGKDNNDNQPKNKGTLKVDATVADQEIKFPTDLNLLNEARENLERMIDILYNKSTDGEKPRTYRRKARQSYLNVAKKKQKSKKIIRKAIKEQLQYVKRDLKHMDKLMADPFKVEKLNARDIKLLNTIKTVYEQQKMMYDTKRNTCPDRIVNLHQPHVHPIVRGKDGRQTEFGAKINVSLVDGFTRVNKFSWDAFNEGLDVEKQVEDFYRLFGCYPKVFLGDQIYLNRKSRNYLKSKGIKIYGKPLGRPPKIEKTAQQKYRDKKQAAKRNQVEGKFGQAKRKYNMNKIKARLQETSESWVNAIIFVMNLKELLKVANKYGYFFVQFLKLFKNYIFSYAKHIYFMGHTSVA